jgi:hypothetical protein
MDESLMDEWMNKKYLTPNKNHDDAVADWNLKPEVKTPKIEDLIDLNKTSVYKRSTKLPLYWIFNTPYSDEKEIP